MRYISIILILLIILIGCGSRNTMYYHIHAADHSVTMKKLIKIHVDSGFKEADRIEINAGVEQWNFALNGYVKLEIVDWEFNMSPSELRNGDWFILKIHSEDIGRPSDTSERTVLAFCDAVGGHYMHLIRDRLGNEDVKGITMHELGHLLGSEHVGGYLMYYQFRRGRYGCVDYASIESVARVQGLDVGLLNYCIYESGI